MKFLPASLFVVLLFSLFFGAFAQSYSLKDYSVIRGANYVPSYALNDVEIWENYDRAVIRKELSYARRIGVNSIRVFLQYIVWQKNPERFLANVDDFLAACKENGLTAMLVIFDSCFGVAPSFENHEFWVANPGPHLMGQHWWSEGERYVLSLMERFRRDPRILMWDIMNEPEAIWYNIHKGLPAFREVFDFCRHFCQFVRYNDIHHPITVGLAFSFVLPEVKDYIDVYSIHNYKHLDSLRADIRQVRKLAAADGKQCLITEFGSPGIAGGQPYDAVVKIAGEEGIGWYIWELMIGRMQFRFYQGVFYPDGSVRNAREAANIAALPPEYFEQKPDNEGIRYGPGPSWEVLNARAIRRIVAQAIPCSPQNFWERQTILESSSYLPKSIFKSISREDLRTFAESVRDKFRKGEETAACAAVDRFFGEHQLADELSGHR